MAHAHFHSFCRTASVAAFATLAVCTALALLPRPARGADQNIAREILNLEAELGNGGDSQILDEIIAEASARIPARTGYSREQALEALGAIHEITLEKGFLYKASSFTLSESLTPRTLSRNELELLASYDSLAQSFLQSGLPYFHTYCPGCVLYLDRQRQEAQVTANPNGRYYFTQCATLSFLYLGVAEALNLPCRALSLPLHIAIRWDLDDGSFINWQPLHGREESDGELAAFYHLDPAQIASGVYLRPLTRDQVLALDWFLIGVAWEDRDNPQRAMEAMQRSLHLDDRNPLTHFHLGVINHTTQHYTAAVRDFTDAINLDPAFARSYLNRGWSLFRSDNFDEAVQDFTRAIELDPRIVEAYLGRGWSEFKKGLLQLALQDFSKAIELDPQNDSGYMGRGATYRQLGEAALAEEDLTRAEALADSPSSLSSAAGSGGSAPSADLLQEIAPLDLQMAVNQLSVQGTAAILAFVGSGDADSIRSLSAIAELLRTTDNQGFTLFVIFSDRANNQSQPELLRRLPELAPLAQFAYYGGPTVADAFQVTTVPSTLLYTSTGNLYSRVEGVPDKYTLALALPRLLSGGP